MKLALFFGCILLAAPLIAAVMDFTGFETGDSTELTSGFNGNSSTSTAVIRHGSYSLVSNPATSAIGWSAISSWDNNGVLVSSQIATPYVRFAFNPITAPSSLDEEFFNFGSTRNLSFRLNSARNIVAYDATGISISTGTNVLTPGWHVIEAKSGVRTADWEIKVDGNSELSGTSNVGTSTTTQIRLGKTVNSNSQSVIFYYDDFIWGNSNYFGDGQTGVLLPISSGTFSNFTVGSGSGPHWQILSHLPATSTNFLNDVSQATETIKTQTRIQAIIAVSTLTAVKPYNALSRNNGAGNTIKLRFGSNGIFDDGGPTAVNFGNPYGAAKIYNIDPKTGLTWAPKAIDTLEVGVIDIGGGFAWQLYSSAIFIDYVQGAITTIYNGTIYNSTLH